jgi:hypothetical protein
VAAISRITLADVVLTPGLLENLLAEGETTVERKQALPKDGLAPTFASFANSTGGWVLLGITDTGEAAGYAWKGRGDLQDHLRDHLAESVDPLPSFAAATVERDGKQIGVVRIPPSSSKPHIVTSTGAIYIRVPGGKMPVRDQQTVLALAADGRRADKDARNRLHGLALSEMDTAPLEMLWGSPPFGSEEVIVEWLVRAAPVTVTGAFADTALRASTGHGVMSRVQALLREHPGSGVREPEARARGFYVFGMSDRPAQLDVSVDAGGKIVARSAYHRERGGVHLPNLERETLLPLLELVLDTFVATDALGRVLLELEIRAAFGMTVWTAFQKSGDIKNGLDNGRLKVGGEIDLPSDPASVAGVVQRWSREIARAARVAAWEPELHDHEN